MCRAVEGREAHVGGPDDIRGNAHVHLQGHDRRRRVVEIDRSCASANHLSAQGQMWVIIVKNPAPAVAMHPTTIVRTAKRFPSGMPEVIAS